MDIYQLDHRGDQGVNPCVVWNRKVDQELVDILGRFPSTSKILSCLALSDYSKQLDEVPLTISSAVCKDNKASLLAHIRDETLNFAGKKEREKTAGTQQGRVSLCISPPLLCRTRALRTPRAGMSAAEAAAV